MQGIRRKVVYVGGYEVLGLAVGTVVMTVVTGEPPATTGPLALMLTGVATTWNLVFNTLFEAWERRQPDRTRTVRRRILHALCFQIPLVCMIVPLMAWWLGVSLMQAFLLDLVFIIYVPFYTFAYNWAFDRIFGVPSSAVNEDRRAEPTRARAARSLRRRGRAARRTAPESAAAVSARAPGRGARRVPR